MGLLKRIFVKPDGGISAVVDVKMNGSEISVPLNISAAEKLQDVDPDAVLSKMHEKLKNKATSNNVVLKNTAALNNRGAELEKAGDLNGAISSYEDNIALGYPATHAYSRLMVLYRKLKRPEDERRVILRALEVFGKENERRAALAIENHPYNKGQILEALESCAILREPDGAVYFNPYPVSTWKARLKKLGATGNMGALV